MVGVKTFRKLTTFTFWASFAEFCIMILLFDQLPRFEWHCVFMSYSCYATAYGMLYHLIWFLFPWLMNNHTRCNLFQKLVRN